MLREKVDSGAVEQVKRQEAAETRKVASPGRARHQEQKFHFGFQIADFKKSG